MLPTDSPDLAKNVLSLAISPMLWAKHKPDRFDMWSAGVLSHTAAKWPDQHAWWGMGQHQTRRGSKGKLM